jgi:general stress protein 26
MSELSQDEIEDRLWREIDKGRFGMLGLTGVRHPHLHPMTAFTEREDGQIWFFTYNDTELARGVSGGDGEGAEAMFVIQSKDQDLQACVGGRLIEDRDQDRIEAYWNPMVAAWYPEGKDDPRLTLLRFDCRDAQVWLTEAGPIKYAWEVAKANMTGHRPDLGEQARLDLH